MSGFRGAWDPDELELNKAAYLAVHERDPETDKPLTQDKIAQRLGTTREQVNRHLQSAKKQGVLRSEYVPSSEDMLDRVILELNYHDVLGELQDYAQRHRNDNAGRQIESVTVISEELPGDDKAWDDSLVRFGMLSAAKTKQFIRELAKLRTPTLGMAWGRILRSVTDAVGPSDFRRLSGKEGIQCVPLWGEPWGPEIPEWRSKTYPHREQLSSSTLARDLEAKLKGQKTIRRRHSLEAVPAMLPRELSAHQDILFHYLERVSSWGEVFGGNTGRKKNRHRTPLASRLHLLLAAAGSVTKPGRFLSPEVLKNMLTEAEAKRLLEIVFGDVGGVLMEKPNLKGGDRKLLADIHARWTGVTESHLRECAAKAAAGKAIGVVVYAMERSRAKPILEAIRRGLITHLVTEMGLAMELKRLAQDS